MAIVVITHADPLRLDLEPIEHKGTPQGQLAVAYRHGHHVVARSVIAEDALPAIRSLLSRPVTLALAAEEDPSGNIEGRLCIVLAIGSLPTSEGDDEPTEPWKASVPAPSFEAETADTSPQGGLALLPIGNVVRPAARRRHPDLPADAREMLVNLLSGGGRDAVSRAIDDLLDSL
jgi:hypothetical protein